MAPLTQIVRVELDARQVQRLIDRVLAAADDPGICTRCQRALHTQCRGCGGLVTLGEEFCTECEGIARFAARTLACKRHPECLKDDGHRGCCRDREGLL